MIAVEHVYLHVPFCRRRCPYCDYAVYAEGPPDLSGWVESLSRELGLREARGVSLSEVETLLVGGGTPSVLGVEGLEGVVTVLGSERLHRLSEWTFEANPEDLDGELLEAWAKAGVTRVNIGVQSLHDPALAFLGRLHSRSVARSAIDAAQQSGVPSWGVDLLFGLPDEVDPDPVQSLREVIDLGVPHVALYELVPERGTPMGEKVASGELGLADGDARADQYLALSELLGIAGYEAYEMMSFALPGHESRHALAVFEGRSWVGLGPGAHSNFGELRVWNLTDWRGYSTAVARGELPEAKTDSSGTDSTEILWFKLRRAQGIARADLSSRGREVSEAWIRKGLAVDDPHRVRLTAEGWLRLDQLSADLARVEAQVEQLRSASH